MKNLTAYCTSFISSTIFVPKAFDRASMVRRQTSFLPCSKSDT